MNPQFFKQAFRGVMLFVAALTIVACEPVEQSELKTWMNQQRKTTPTTVTKISPPVQFQAAPYTMGAELDPFDSQKLKAALAKARAMAGANALQPDLKRRKEVLESFPLDNIKMVGFLLRQNKPTALVTAGDGLYNVTLGNYLGGDFGRVVSLNDKELTIKELVQDGSGEWTERITKLPIQAAAKEGKK